MHRGRHGQKAWCATRQFSTSPPTWKLSEPNHLEFDGVILDMRLIKPLVISNPFNFSPSSLPRGQGVRNKNSNTLTTWLVLPVTSPYPYIQSNSHFINTQKSIYHLGNSKSFQSCVPEMGMNTKSVLIISHNIIGTYQEAQQLRLHLPMQGVQVRSLVRELRSHMPWGPRNQNIKQKQYYDKIQYFQKIKIS